MSKISIQDMKEEHLQYLEKKLKKINRDTLGRMIATCFLINAKECLNDNKEHEQFTTQEQTECNKVFKGYIIKNLLNANDEKSIILKKKNTIISKKSVVF